MAWKCGKIVLLHYFIILFYYFHKQNFLRFDFFPQFLLLSFFTVEKCVQCLKTACLSAHQMASHLNA